ncbi:hypothetical protein [Spirosoma sp. 48-14]|nr:hypothetical protein [Spirosoma sp. 48-14]
MTFENPRLPDTTYTDTPSVTDSTSNRLSIRIGSRTFKATLLTNPTVKPDCP